MIRKSPSPAPEPPDEPADAGEVDVVFDVIGGDVVGRSAALVRAGG